MTREELLSSPGYWEGKIQQDLYREIQNFMDVHGLNRTQLAEKLGVSKGYVSQVLNGSFNHKIEKLVDLALGIGLVPLITYKPISQVINEDKWSKAVSFSITPMGSLGDSAKNFHSESLAQQVLGALNISEVIDRKIQLSLDGRVTSKNLGQTQEYV